MNALNATKGWRTIGVNVAVLLMAITDYLMTGGLPVISQVLGTPEAAALTVGALNVLNIGLRILTTTPVGESK